MSDVRNRLSVALADRYRIERELGAGGMATVYLAEDLKHDRKVAIKVLKPELAAVLGAERFLGEIKTTANLQHPHILPLHDSGAVEGTVFYVMPFVEGETLRDHLTREKQLSIPEAVRIATEVAAALDYAHRRGVIHRDIKPENILLHDGSAVVADFGIALAASNIGGTRMTETGISLGTPHYMSPEQALGEREITARSDIYALGCVLYEMLTGEPPFDGPTAQAIIAKLMTDDPRPPAQLRKTIPRHVDAAARTALARLPADRFSSAAAFGEALANPQYGADRSGAHAMARGGWRLGTGWALAAGLAIGALGTWVVLRERMAMSGVQPPTQITFSGRAGSPAISPDGGFVAFLEQRCPEPPGTGGCLNLEVLEVGSTSPVEVITGADRLGTPRWSHDGLSLVVAGALEGGRSGLYLIPRLGGTPRRIADEPVGYDTHPTADSVLLIFNTAVGTELRPMSLAAGSVPGAGLEAPGGIRDVAWSPDAKLIAAPDLAGTVSILGRDGSVRSSISIRYGRLPVRWSVDGRSILLFQGGAGEEDDLVSFPVGADGTAGTRQVLPYKLRTLAVGRFDVARGTGRLVVGIGIQTNDIWGFDLDGDAVRDRRLTHGTNWYSMAALDPEGRVTYFLRADALGDNLYALVEGRERALTAERQFTDNSVRLSLDGRLLAFEAQLNERPVLQVYDRDAGTTRTLTRTYRSIGWPIGGGQDILWMESAPSRLWLSDSAGNQRHELSVPSSIGTLDRFGGGWAIAPDGLSIAVTGTRTGGYSVVRIPVDGGPATTLHELSSSAAEQAAGVQDVTGEMLDVGIGLAGWTRDGIYLVRGRANRIETELMLLDPTTRRVRPVARLPVACAPRTAVIAASGGKVACVVTDARSDLTVIDGVLP